MTGGTALPRATYRLQLRNGVGFAEARRMLPYFAQLRVSHVYLSPILRAARGSSHGYDVIDPREVDPALGGEDAFRAFAAEARSMGLGILLDIVPNHMAIAADNPWWWDLLANGPASRYAGHFDVDWSHPEPHLRHRVLLPILQDHYGRVLETGEIRLEWTGRGFDVRVGEERLPSSPRSIEGLVRAAAQRDGLDPASAAELGFIADALGALTPSTTIEPSQRARRHRDASVLVGRLRSLAEERRPVDDALAAAAAATSGDVNLLDQLLERQNYRLAWWRAARRDLGYRRFFDVTTLVGLRIDDEAVFRDTHARILEWLEEGVIDGVRVDHPDGLRDPEGYLRRLRWAAPRAWIVVEKILGREEALRRSWPVDGTTGYEWLNRFTRLLADPAGEARLTELAAPDDGPATPFDALALATKSEVLRNVLGSELGRLTALLLDVLEGQRRHRDHTRHDLHEALAALAAALPVYRTYVRAAAGSEPGIVSPEDEAIIANAVETAKRLHSDVPSDLFDVIGDLLALRLAGNLEGEFVARFQQLTGAVAAKGIEDTAFYRDLRLPALDEVGGDPGCWSSPPEAIHTAAREAAAHPLGLVATSTHDTKRSEDVRARLLVLSGIPERWASAVDDWRRRLDETQARVDAHGRLLLLETLVGAWPIDAERLVAYLAKAAREAKLRTSWTEPDEAYEATLLGLARRALEDGSLRTIVESLVAEILAPGRVNSLVQLAMKLTLPGVCDVYQGTELWDLSLVDPDNRRPVDLGLRARLLAECDAWTAAAMTSALADPADPGRPKLWLLARLLELRRRRAGSFGAGAAYRPLEVEGRTARPAALAFARGPSPDDAPDAPHVVVVVPIPTATPARWFDADTRVRLPGGAWHDVSTGAAVAGGPRSLDELLRVFPVAVLERDVAAKGAG